MENLSDMFNNIYESLAIADATALANVGSIGADFIDDTIAITQGTATESTLSEANRMLGIITPWLTSAAPLLFPEAEIGTDLFGTVLDFTSAMMGNYDEPGTAPITAQSEGLNTSLKATRFLSDCVTSLQGSVESVHDNIFNSATSITTFLSGVVDDAGLELKVLNYVWWLQNVFIQYIPYGTVISNVNGQTTQFTEDICAGVFLHNDPDLIWCHTEDSVAGTSLGPGMARLTCYDRLATGNSPQHPNPGQDEIEATPNSNGLLNMSSTAPGVLSTQ